MSEETPHPITLASLVFTRCFIESVPEHEPEGKRPLAHPTNNIEVTKVPGDTGAWAASMSSIFNVERDKASPYHFDMRCMGIFHADGTLSEEEAARGVTITAHSVLYGAIRESVAWLSGRQVYGSLMLGLSVLQGKKSSSSRVEHADAQIAPDAPDPAMARTEPSSLPR
jgi:hypothetical protein